MPADPSAGPAATTGRSHAGATPPPHQVPRGLEITMLALAFCMLPLVILEESSTDDTVLLWAESFSALVWIAFVGEYLFLLARAVDRGRYVRDHWFDLLIIVLTPPVVWLPNEMAALRALRAVRLVRAIAVVGRTQHTLRRYLRRGSLPYLLILSVFVVAIGGLAIHALEPDTAESVGDGIWWAAATLSTVGYGDIAPTTLAGRIVAVIIMVVGVGTFAGLTAGIAAYFVENEAQRGAPAVPEHQQQLTEIQRELRALRAELGEFGRSSSPLLTRHERAGATTTSPGPGAPSTDDP